VVLAQDLAAAGEGVLTEDAGLLVFAQCGPAAGEVVGRVECVGVVLTELVAGEGVRAPQQVGSAVLA
jgi:hypothetical protein